MALPNVNISTLGGQLGRTKPTADSLAGLLLSGVAVDGSGHIGLSDPKQIFDLTGLADLGITVDNNPLAFNEVTSFYNKAGAGAELWIMLFSDTTTLADACLKTNNIVRKLLDAAEGKIRILGVNKALPDGYEMSNDECIDADVLQAKLNLQATIAEYRAAHKPLRALLPGLGFDKTKLGSLHDCQEDTTEAVGIVMWSESESGQPAVGFTLGKAASLPVQRNLGRVKDGDIGLLQAYYPDGTPITDLESAWGNIHDKGYISLRKIYGKSGFFFTDDLTCVSQDSDFNSFSRGRTIDKAHVISYGVLSNEINDDVDVTDDGKIPPALIGYYQANIENALNTQMKGNISKASAYIDPNQDILGTDTMNVSIKVRPKGQMKDIEATLSFDNPFSTN